MMMSDVSSILLKRFRRMRPGGFLLAAALLLVFTDFFHFAFHDAAHRVSVSAFSLPADGVPEALPDDSPSDHHAGFCPVCEGILISDGPPVSSAGLSFPAYVSDPLFSGTGSYASLAFLLPQGRAPPRASLS